MRLGGWRWYVFGAQAVVAYGRPRMTGDVDVTVDVGRSSTRDLLRALGERSFRMRFDPTDEHLASTRLLPMIHERTRMPVDVVLARSELQAEFLRRSRAVDIGGHSVPVISAEDLIVTKVLAGRRKDLEDIRGVLLTQWDALDFEYVDRLLTALEDANQDPRLRRRLARQVSQAAKLLGRR
ncbi:MAG: nucleotidyltransferase [Polyangiaceae bacterium]